jgi:hypothetical protein
MINAIILIFHENETIEMKRAKNPNERCETRRHYSVEEPRKCK